MKSIREIELERSIAELQQKIDQAGLYLETCLRHENTLKWINHLATLHYLGDAFDPEHMRTLANMAADSLDMDCESLPDYDNHMEEARESARKWAEKTYKIFESKDED